MASVAAVDVCGQISETSQSELNVMASDKSQLSNQNACNQQPAIIGLGFAGTLAIVMTFLTIALGGILIYMCRYLKRVSSPQSENHENGSNCMGEREGGNGDGQASEV